jgi:uncharacterized protein (DUF2252 family)
MWKATTVTRDGAGVARFECDYQTVAQRKELGKVRRAETPREAHAGWDPSGADRDPVEVLVESNRGRLERLVPIRYGRMLKSPLAFYRGSAALMARDLSSAPASEIAVQACGDCHLSNFGLFATPERNLVFDINDFDETHPAPFEWDLKRLAASLSIASRSNGFSKGQSDEVVRRALATYREAVRRFSTMTVLDVWYLKLRIEDIIGAARNVRERKNRERIAATARSRLGENVFPKITENVDGRARIIDNPPLIFHTPPEARAEENFLAVFNDYVGTLSPDRQFLLDRYRIVDMVVKVVGVGSVGTRCGVLLLLGQDDSPLLIQIKEARSSVLEPFTAPGAIRHQGERVVRGQRLMQSASDAFLGWSTGPLGIHFYLRLLRDMKYSLDVESLLPYQMANYAEACGLTLARAHARAGDAAEIAGYVGKSDVFDRALASFANDYADQNLRDYRRLADARESGEIVAKMDL